MIRTGGAVSKLDFPSSTALTLLRRRDGHRSRYRNATVFCAFNRLNDLYDTAWHHMFTGFKMPWPVGTLNKVLSRITQRPLSGSAENLLKDLVGSVADSDLTEAPAYG